MNNNCPAKQPHDQSLSIALWLTLSVGAFVLVGSLALLALVQHQVRREEAASFEALAKANASFLDRTPLPQSQQMARQLGEVMGAEVSFQKADKLTSADGTVHEVEAHLVPTDGKARLVKESLMASHKLRNGSEVIFKRAVIATPVESIFKRTDTWLALGVFWALAFALAAWLARRLSRPLAHLAKVAPLIGSETELPSLPTQRSDEIGQLARSLSGTHQSLRNEREARRAAERLAMLGRMATSLAHEVRNPVTAIRLHAQLLEGASPEDAASSRGLIESEAARIESLVCQWMMFAKPAAPVMREFEVEDLIERTMRVLEPQAAHAGVRMKNEVSDAILTGDAERLGQVIHNLLLNAIQAMPHGGTITVAAESSAGRVRSLIIEDGGTGFSEAALNHATDVFFSEKEGGMGLGLAVASEICKAHGAALVISNRVEGGARVTLRFDSSSSA